MPNWVSFVKARRFPAVRNKYKTPTQFRSAVRTEAAGSATWARFRPASTVPASDASWQVDADAITLVRPVWAGGALKS